MSQENNFMLRLNVALPGLENLEQDVLLFVGVPQEARNDRTGMLVADYAAWNEFGTKNIPARPAIRQTVDTYIDEYVEDLADALLSGVAPEMAMNRLGEQMAKDISQSISDWQQPANAPSTIAKKGENNPLVDTETYAKSVGHWVGKK